MVKVWLRVGVGVAIERDRQGVDAHHLERPGADRADAAVWAGGDLGRRHPVEDMLGDDSYPQCERKGRARRLQCEHDLVRATGADPHLAPIDRPRLLVLQVLEDVEGEEDVVGGERLAVGPFHASADVERVAQVIVGYGPVGGEQPDDVLPRVHRGQALVDDAVNVTRGVISFEKRIEHAGLTDQGLDRGAAVCRLGHSRPRLAGHERRHRRHRGGDDPPIRDYGPVSR